MSPANVIARLFVSVLFNVIGVLMALYAWAWLHDTGYAWKWLIWCGVLSWFIAPDRHTVQALIDTLKEHSPRPWP